MLPAAYAAGSQQCCRATGSQLYAAGCLCCNAAASLCCYAAHLLADLPSTACRKTAGRKLPAEQLPAENERTNLYTAAVWPRPYCRLTGPVQPITARRLLASAAAQPRV
jgi:hypothetical protein